MHADNIRQTATSPRSLDRLALTVRHSAGGVLAVTLIQVDANECEFSCPSEESAVLPLGTVIMLVLSSPELEQRLEIPATVVFRAEHSDGRRYVARFINTVQLPLPLYALVTRRSGYRVKPAPREPLSIRVSAAPPNDQSRQPPGQTGQMEDISVSGVGICLKRDCEAEFASCEQVHLEIELPGRRPALRLMGRIKNRKLEEGKLVYGVEFDRERSASFAEQERAIGDYVAARLQDEIKRVDEVDGRLGTFL